MRGSELAMALGWHVGSAIGTLGGAAWALDKCTDAACMTYVSQNGELVGKGVGGYALGGILGFVVEFVVEKAKEG